MNATSGREIQVEEGNYTRIHNIILEKLAAAKLNGSEFRCLMLLFRKTYGFGKKKDRISFNQWHEGTGIDKRQLVRILQGLEDKQFIYSMDNGNNRAKTYGFNKYLWDNQSSGESTTTLVPSSGESTTKSSGESTTTLVPSSGESTTKSSGESTTHKRKKEVAATTTAFSFSQNGHDASNNFVAEYQRIWGKAITTKARRDEVEEWSHRVTLDEWRYALDESASYDQIGNWRYLERILKRVESEGLPALEIQPASAPTSVNFSVDEILR